MPEVLRRRCLRAAFAYKDYVLGASAGQTMDVTLTSPSPAVEFVIFDRNMNNLDDATEQTEWSGTLPSNGSYTIRVMMPRSAARRGKTASYSLKISIH